MGAAKFIQCVLRVPEDERCLRRAGDRRGNRSQERVAELKNSPGGHIRMKISAKAPCRVDMAGGTIDIWPLYLFHTHPLYREFCRGPVCQLRAGHARRWPHRSAIARSGRRRVVRFARAACAAKRYKLPLLAYLVRYFAPSTGIDLFTDSEAPAGAGIAGSSTLIIAVASALNRLNNAGHKIEKFREISQNIEAQIIRVPTGCQDYYPAMYGGLERDRTYRSRYRPQAHRIDLEDLTSALSSPTPGSPGTSESTIGRS